MEHHFEGDHRDENAELHALTEGVGEHDPSFWDAHPTAKRYAKSFAIAGPFGVAVTFVGDTAPYVVRRAIDGLGGCEAATG